MFSNLRYLKKFLYSYKWSYLIGFITLLLTNLCIAAIPWLTKDLFNSLKKWSDTGAGFDKRALSVFIGLIFAAALFQAIFRTWSRVVIYSLSRGVEYDLRGDIFRHLEKLPPSFYQRFRTGDLMSRMTNDISSVRILMGFGFLTIVNTTMTYAINISAMAVIDWGLTLWVLTPFPVIMLLVKFSSKAWHRQYLAVQEELGRISAKVQENISGMMVVKAYTQEEHEISEFEEINRSFLKQNLKLARTMGLLFPLFGVAGGFTTLIFLNVGGKAAINGVIDIGDFVAFVGYLAILASPTVAFGWILNLFQRASAAMGRISEIIYTEPSIQDEDGLENVTNIEGRIEFRNLTFKYPQDSSNGQAGHNGLKTREAALQNINLEIKAGSTVALVGRTGSGKSTLVSSIPRLIEIERNQLFIDGRDIHDIPLEDLRRAIGFVPQDAFLFSSNIGENIAFGSEANSDKIVKYSEIARIEEDIRSFTNGWDTVVGERGLTVSGGQRQRITLARGLIKEPSILILDDSLSSVDTHTEEEILKGLRKAMKNRTSIIIAHRISTVKDADLIVVLDNGAIVERGSHEELLKHGGIYAEIYKQQQLTEELEHI